MVYSSQSSSNPDYISNFSLKVFNNTNGISCFNATGSLDVPALKILIYVTLKGKSIEALKVYDEVILKGVLDSCKLSQGIFGNFIAQFVVENLHKYSNIKIECPQKRGFYYVSNFPLETDHIPIYLNIFRNRKFEFSLTMKVKLRDIKQLVYLFTMQFEGQNFVSSVR